MRPHIRASVVAANAGFATIGLVLAAAWAWPLYRDPRYVVMAASVIVVAVGIAVAGAVCRARVWQLVTVTAMAFLLLGVPLAVPSGAIGNLLPTLAGIRDLVVGTVTSWRKLLTISVLPVGTFQTLMVPAFLVLLVFGVAGASLAIRLQGGGVWGVVVTCAASLFGPAFGVVRGTGTLHLGQLLLPQLREVLLGVGVFLLALAWVAWRTRPRRRRSLHATVRSTVASLTLVGLTLGCGCVVAAASAGEARDALRGSVTPSIELTAWNSPLAAFRSYFADDAYDSTLLTVAGAGADQRVRLAVMDDYDGVTFRVAGADGSGTIDRYEIVPGVRESDVDGETVTVRVESESYTGIWVPGAGDLESVDFDSGEHGDALYYGSSTGNVIDLTQRSHDGAVGIEPGDAYTYTGVVSSSPDASSAPASIGNLHVPSGEDFPELHRWLDSIFAADRTGYSPATLQGVRNAIRLLTSSGYLSHGIDETAPDGTAPAWVASLVTGRVVPSRAGGSQSRIEELFAELNEGGWFPRAAEIEMEPPTVSAVGDDEQFAIAGALAARAMGFPSRVVLGFMPEEGGIVKGRDTRAWVEVRLAEGPWTAIDATPQSAVPPRQLQVNDSTPRFTPVVPPVEAEIEPPSRIAPTPGDDTDSRTEEKTSDLVWLRDALKVTAAATLLLAAASGPFLAIIIAKKSRRRRRRLANPVRSMVGAWDEVVDAAVDAGADVDLVATRREIAAVLGGGAPALAVAADRAAYGPEAPTRRDVHDLWDRACREAKRFQVGQGRWAGLRCALSLRSYARSARRSELSRGREGKAVR